MLDSLTSYKEEDILDSLTSYDALYLEVNVEFFRTKNSAGDKYQWCDSERFMVIDTVTGESQNIKGDCVVMFDECKEFVSNIKGWENRLIIAKVSCVSAFKI